MHKLERPEAPGCLARYQDGPKDWKRVSAAEKQDIWVKLEAMQGLRCAYCEEQLYPKRRHIEHFRQRSDYPQGTFQWDNLFGSCDKADSCGKHKDRQSYSYGDILKPDIDNQDDYLRFLSDGRIVPRKNLPADRLHRAEETLRYSISTMSMGLCVKSDTRRFKVTSAWRVNCKSLLTLMRIFSWNISMMSLRPLRGCHLKPVFVTC